MAQSRNAPHTLQLKMRTLLKRIRGALLMGLIWAVVWAPLGLLIGMIVDPDGSMDEPWIAVGTYPGFIAGVFFSIVLGIAARRRRLEDLSMARVAGWGALAGAMLGTLPFLLGDVKPSALFLIPVFLGATTLLSAGSAAGSLALARKAAAPKSLDGVEDVEKLGT
jgi:hypothetical protein